jgi:Na+-driven multidrug efflux pump
MVSNIIGQGLSERVTELIRKIIRLSLFFSVTVGIVINLIPATVLSVYGQDVSFIIEAIPVLRVVSIAMIIMSIGTIWLNAVTGTGNTKMNLLIELFAIFFYSIYVYVVLEWKNMSILYGWGSEWLYWICMFIPSYLYIKSNKWVGKKI